jgi:hypothetical protein
VYIAWNKAPQLVRIAFDKQFDRIDNAGVFLVYRPECDRVARSFHPVDEKGDGKRPDHQTNETWSAPWLSSCGSGAWGRGARQFCERGDQVKQTQGNHRNLGQAVAAEFPPYQLPLPGAEKLLRSV